MDRRGFTHEGLVSSDKSKVRKGSNKNQSNRGEALIPIRNKGTSPGVHSLQSVEEPGLKGLPGRVTRGAQGEVHLDLDSGTTEKETSK